MSEEAKPSAEPSREALKADALIARALAAAEDSVLDGTILLHWRVQRALCEEIAKVLTASPPPPTYEDGVRDERQRWLEAERIEASTILSAPHAYRDAEIARLRRIANDALYRLERRAASFAAEPGAIFNGAILCDELKSHAKELRNALATEPAPPEGDQR